MTRRMFVTVCVAFTMAIASPIAQSRKGAPDPISGAWTGELAREGGARPIAITFQLKLDARGAVTGTMAGMPNPADVKTGTFNAGTAVLKLEVGKAGEPAVLLSFDGKVAKGVATGKFTGEDAGTFKITKQP